MALLKDGKLEKSVITPVGYEIWHGGLPVPEEKIEEYYTRIYLKSYKNVDLTKNNKTLKNSAY